VSAKTAILNSVLKLVNREGFYHLNMKKIADEAGIAAGTIYVHFDGKERLINELYKMITGEFRASLLAGYDAEKTFTENFYGMLCGALDYFVEDPDRFSFLEQYTFSPFLFKETKQENFHNLEVVVRFLKEGKKQKLLKVLPEEMLVSLIYGPVIMMMRLHISHHTDLCRKANRQKLLQSCWESIALPVAEPIIPNKKTKNTVTLP